MKSLILGGVKSGKSGFAESMAAASGRNVTVIATASANDDEMEARINLHKASRPVHWQTIEEPIELGSILAKLDIKIESEQAASEPACIIIDCLTLWVTNLLMLDDVQTLEKEKNNLVEAVARFEQQLIIVSNETNMGIVPMSELSRRFCDETGLLHQSIARQVDHVVLMVAGLSHTIKGQDCPI